MTIAYSTKVNQRVLGTEPVIASESHIVGITGVNTSEPDFIKLIEVPLQDSPSSIAISGFTEVTTIPGTNEFLVDYANGRIQFHTSRNGQLVSVTYKGRGSVVDAVDINELQAPVGVALDLDGEITAGHVKPASISTNPSDNFTFPNNLTVTGNLTVSGTTTTVNTATVTIEDPILQLNFGLAAANSGIQVERDSDPAVQFIWNEANDSWQMKDTSGNPIVEAFDVGGMNVEGTIIATKDNASSLRVRGPNHASEGGTNVQSYAGIFYNDAYDTLGTLKTRASFGANLEMDLALQSPHALMLLATDGTQTDGVLIATSRTNFIFHARADVETESPNQLIIDRVSTGSTGLANTSDVNLRVNTGNLYFNSGLSDNAVVLPSVAGDVTSLVAGACWFDSVTNQFKGYNGTDVVVLG